MKKLRKLFILLMLLIVPYTSSAVVAFLGGRLISMFDKQPSDIVVAERVESVMDEFLKLPIAYRSHFLDTILDTAVLRLNHKESDFQEVLDKKLSSTEKDVFGKIKHNILFSGEYLYGRGVIRSKYSENNTKELVQLFDLVKTSIVQVLTKKGQLTNGSELLQLLNSISALEKKEEITKEIKKSLPFVIQSHNVLLVAYQASIAKYLIILSLLKMEGADSIRLGSNVLDVLDATSGTVRDTIDSTTNKNSCSQSFNLKNV